MRIKKGFPLFLIMVLTLSPVMVRADEVQYYRHTFTVTTPDDAVAYKYPEATEDTDGAHSKVSVKVKVEVSSEAVENENVELDENQLLTKKGNPENFHYLWGPKNKDVSARYDDAKDGDQSEHSQKGGLSFDGGSTELYLTAPDVQGGDYELMIGVPQGTYCRNSGSSPLASVDDLYNGGGHDYYLSKDVTVKLPELNVTVEPETVTLYLDSEKTKKLTATVTPENAYYECIDWYAKSAGNGVEPYIIVQGNGTVVAQRPGIGYAYAVAARGSNSVYSKDIKVIVKERKEVPVENITLAPTTASLAPGETADIKATVTPANATDPSLQWSSGNESVATVDNNGKVTAKGTGQAVITARSTANPEVSAKATITVQVKEEEKGKDIPVTAVSLSPTAATLAPGETVELKATVAPADATDRSINWSSDDTSVATVDKNGKVTAADVGEAVITATSVSDPSISTGAVITVETEGEEEEEEEENIPVTKVTLDPKTVTLIPGETVELDATVEPEDATDCDLTWSTSNKNIATIDDGEVTAVAPGTAKITAEADGKSATATIKVAGMQLGTDKLVIKQGKSKSVSGTFVNDKIKSAEVTKDKNDVINKVTVDKSGKKLTVRTNKKTGDATVRVTSAAGISKTLKVTAQKDKVTTKTVKILDSNGKAKSSFTVKKNRSLTLTIKATPDQVSTGEKAEIEKNTNKKRASAEIKNGKLVVKGLQKGNTKITVKVGKVRKTIRINVKKK